MPNWLVAVLESCICFGEGDDVASLFTLCYTCILYAFPLKMGKGDTGSVAEELSHK